MITCIDATLTMNAEQLTQQELEKLIENQDASVIYVEKNMSPNSCYS